MPRRAVFDSGVVDNLGRPLRDLRISVTDRCNFRCRYCMPRERFGEEHTFLPRRAYLSFDEIEKVVLACKPLGLEKVRITGGEPLLRPNLPNLVGHSRVLLSGALVPSDRRVDTRTLCRRGRRTRCLRLGRRYQ